VNDDDTCRYKEPTSCAFRTPRTRSRGNFTVAPIHRWGSMATSRGSS